MDSSRRPTLADVARRAGTSAKTVSRTLNGDGPVSPATREKVLAAVAELGFRLNPMARGMRRGEPDATVGLIVPEIANPFFSTVAGGVEEVVRARGLILLLGSSDGDPGTERSLVEAFLSRRVSALLVVPAPGAGHAFLRGEQAAGLPLVFVDRPATGLAADAVLSANADGARTGVAHLLAHGHRRVAFVGDRPANLHTRAERFRGYRSALAGAGLAPDPALVAHAHGPGAAGAAVRRLLALDDPPTAFLTANNLATTGALPVLAEAGRACRPALVAFDDLPLAGLLDPGLTVVAQDPVALGRAAAEAALARLDGRRARPRTTTMPTRLVVRGSGEVPPPERPAAG